MKVAPWQPVADDVDIVTAPGRLTVAWPPAGMDTVTAWLATLTPEEAPLTAQAPWPPAADTTAPLNPVPVTSVVPGLVRVTSRLRAGPPG